MLPGELFAQAPVDQFPGTAVESVTDSSRYFVIRIEDGNGRCGSRGGPPHEKGLLCLWQVGLIMCCPQDAGRLLELASGTEAMPLTSMLHCRTISSEWFQATRAHASSLLSLDRMVSQLRIPSWLCGIRLLAGPPGDSLLLWGRLPSLLSSPFPFPRPCLSLVSGPSL